MSDEKKLFDYDLCTLDLKSLMTLEGELMEKLIIVSREFVARYTTLIELAAGTPNAEETRRVFAEGAARHIKMIVLLEAALE